jgi:hypothetical protein
MHDTLAALHVAQAEHAQLLAADAVVEPPPAAGKVKPVRVKREIWGM